VHPLVHDGFGGVDVPVEVDDAELAVDVLGQRLRVGVADRVVPTDMTGKAPASRMWEMPRSIWSNVFSMFDGMTKMSPASPMLISSSRSIPMSGL